MVKKEFIKIKTEDLIPYGNNPRHNEEAVPDVAESIRQCGDLDPIEVDENNVILSGHTRLLALRQQGFTETDVIRYTGLTEEQKKKYRLLANKTGEKATWDLEKLAEELDDLDFDGFDFGFDLDLENIEEEPEVYDDDYDPKPPEDPKSKRGDIYKLGRHRNENPERQHGGRAVQAVPSGCFSHCRHGDETRGGVLHLARGLGGL